MIKGVIKYQYDYDENGNILVETVDNVDIVSSYDHQDRLINRGDKEYIFTDRESLLKVIENGSETIFDYDVFGNLLEVFCLAASPKRRLRSPRVGWAAFLDQNGDIDSYFIYGTRSNVPEYMIKDGKKYKFIVDHLGSVRKVIDLDTKEVVQEIKYTPYGKIINDSNPDFQPFYYVGGIYDQDTGLIRYGARDYNPETHRWTSKEPLGFAGSMNFYGYCEGDPVNFVDVNGLKTETANFPGRQFFNNRRKSKSAFDLAIKSAFDFLKYVICDSIKNKREYGTYVIHDLAKDEIYPSGLDAMKGDMKSVNIGRTKDKIGFLKSDKIIMLIHTHIVDGLLGNTCYDAEDFSKEDIYQSEIQNIPSVIGTVNGNVKIYFPSNNFTKEEENNYKNRVFDLGKLDLSKCVCPIANGNIGSKCK